MAHELACSKRITKKGLPPPPGVPLRHFSGTYSHHPVPAPSLLSPSEKGVSLLGDQYIFDTFSSLLMPSSLICLFWLFSPSAAIYPLQPSLLLSPQLSSHLPSFVPLYPFHQLLHLSHPLYICHLHLFLFCTGEGFLYFHCHF